MGAVLQVAFAIGAAVLVGVLDAALVVFGVAGAGGSFQYVPARIWLMGPIAWTVVAVLLGGVILAFTRRRAGQCVAFALGMALVAIRLTAHPVLLVSFGAGHSATPSPVAPRQPSGGPNVIVIFLDTVRYDALFDAQGRVHADLPTLSRLRAESVVFTRAYATSPWTLPSHLSAVTGLPAHELGVSFDAQRYERQAKTLAERFHERGYRTAAVISNSFLNAGSGFERGFETFQQAKAGLDLCRIGPALMADRHWPWFAASVCNWTAGEVTERARALLHDDQGPFFLALNYMDAHDPYYVERGCDGEPGYAAAIRCLDRNLAPIVDWRSPSRPTVLAIVGDHGEQFGEHGLQRHGNSLYVQLLHVPFIVRPGSDAGLRTSETPLSIAALPALLGDTTRTESIEPVLSVLHPPAATLAPSEWSALDGTWHLIVRERGSDALYHLPTDPAEERNLIATAPADPAIARLRAAVQMMRRTPKPDLRRFRSLGYVH